MKVAIALFFIIGMSTVLEAVPILSQGRSGCFDAVDPGLHRMNIDAWYYNADKDECLPFTFGGGYARSRNNFNSKKECDKTCLKNVGNSWNQRKDNKAPKDSSNAENIIYFEDD